MKKKDWSFITRDNLRVFSSDFLNLFFFTRHDDDNYHHKWAIIHLFLSFFYGIFFFWFKYDNGHHRCLWMDGSHTVITSHVCFCFCCYIMWPLDIIIKHHHIATISSFKFHSMWLIQSSFFNYFSIHILHCDCVSFLCVFFLFEQKNYG